MQYREELVNSIDNLNDKIGYLVGWITTIMVPFGFSLLIIQRFSLELQSYVYSLKQLPAFYKIEN